MIGPPSTLDPLDMHALVAPGYKLTIQGIRKHSVHDELFDRPILVAAVGQISSDFDRNFPLPELLHRDLQRVRLVLDVHHHRCVHAVTWRRNRDKRRFAEKRRDNMSSYEPRHRLNAARGKK